MNIKIFTTKHVIISSILALTLIAFYSSVSNDFVNYDDQFYIINNYLIKTISLKNIFNTYYFDNYIPLTTLSYAIQYHFFQLNPHPYHLVNLIIHLFNIILVFEFIQILSKNIKVSAITAALFAVHPMHVESVAWISEHKDVLYSLFYISSLIFYIKYINNKSLTNSHKLNIKYYIITVILFFLSLLSKPSAITLPLSLFLIDFYFNRFKIKPQIPNLKSHISYLLSHISLFIEKLPFFILALIFGIINYIAQHSGGMIDLPPHYSLFDKPFIVLYSIAFYLFQFLLPFNLCAVHPFPLKNNLLPALYYIVPLILLITSWLCYKLFFIKSKFKSLAYLHYALSSMYKVLLFGLGFFLVNIILYCQIIIYGNSVVAERYTYLSYIGLAFIIANLYSAFSSFTFKHIRLLKPAMLMIIFIILAFSFQTFIRVKAWKNTSIFYTDVINKNPQQINYAYYERGLDRHHKNNYIGAISDYTEAILLSSNLNHISSLNKLDFNVLFNSYLNRADCEKHIADILFTINYQLSVNNYFKAIYDYSKVIKMNPHFIKAYNMRADIKSQIHDYIGAIADFDTSVSLSSKSNALKTINDQLTTNLYITYFNRGNVKFYLKNDSGAFNDYHKTISLNPTFAAAYFNIANLKLLSGDTVLACKYWIKASNLGYANAQNLINRYCK